MFLWKACNAQCVLFHAAVLWRQIWVHSGHNGSGYFTVYGDEALQSDHFNSRLSFGDTQTIWARTGYLGFLRRTELTDASGGNPELTQLSPQFYWLGFWPAKCTRCSLAALCWQIQFYALHYVGFSRVSKCSKKGLVIEDKPFRCFLWPDMPSFSDAWLNSNCCWFRCWCVHSIY